MDNINTCATCAENKSSRLEIGKLFSPMSIAIMFIVVVVIGTVVVCGKEYISYQKDSETKLAIKEDRGDGVVVTGSSLVEKILDADTIGISFDVRLPSEIDVVSLEGIKETRNLKNKILEKAKAIGITDIQFGGTVDSSYYYKNSKNSGSAGSEGYYDSSEDCGCDSNIIGVSLTGNASSNITFDQLENIAKDVDAYNVSMDYYFSDAYSEKIRKEMSEEALKLAKEDAMNNIKKLNVEVVGLYDINSGYSRDPYFYERSEKSAKLKMYQTVDYLVR